MATRGVYTPLTGAAVLSEEELKRQLQLVYTEMGTNLYFPPFHRLIPQDVYEDLRGAYNNHPSLLSASVTASDTLPEVPITEDPREAAIFLIDVLNALFRIAISPSNITQLLGSIHALHDTITITSARSLFSPENPALLYLQRVRAAVHAISPTHFDHPVIVQCVRYAFRDHEFLVQMMHAWFLQQRMTSILAFADYAATLRPSELYSALVRFGNARNATPLLVNTFAARYERASAATGSELASARVPFTATSKASPAAVATGTAANPTSALTSSSQDVSYRTASSDMRNVHFKDQRHSTPGLPMRYQTHGGDWPHPSPSGSRGGFRYRDRPVLDGPSSSFRGSGGDGRQSYRPYSTSRGGRSGHTAPGPPFVSHTSSAQAFSGYADRDYSDTGRHNYDDDADADQHTEAADADSDGSYDDGQRYLEEHTDEARRMRRENRELYEKQQEAAHASLREEYIDSIYPLGTRSLVATSQIEDARREFDRYSHSRRRKTTPTGGPLWTTTPTGEPLRVHISTAFSRLRSDEHECAYDDSAAQVSEFQRVSAPPSSAAASGVPSSGVTATVTESDIVPSSSWSSI